MQKQIITITAKRNCSEKLLLKIRQDKPLRLILLQICCGISGY